MTDTEDFNNIYFGY